MYARRVLPFLLIAGGVMMFMRHKRLEMMGEGEEGALPRPMGLHGPHGHCGERSERSEWSKRVPPLFEMWHQRAHEQEQTAPQSSAPAPAA